jgi:DNA ligase-1
MRALASATGRQLSKIKTDYEQYGDLGRVAQVSRSTQPTIFVPPRLTLLSVFRSLHDIALISGPLAQQRKVDKIKLLLVACRGAEARYIVRSLEGKLRIGLAEQTVLVSVAQAAYLSNSNSSIDLLPQKLLEATATLKQIYCELPSYSVVVPALLAHSIAELPSICRLTPSIPVRPMLAQPTRSVGEVLERFEAKLFTSEYKYDGERAQIHRTTDGRVFIYSRNLENLTAKYPDLVHRISNVSLCNTRNNVSIGPCYL